MKTFILIFSLIVFSVSASDLTTEYRSVYETETDFTAEELAKLKDTHILLIPGIVSEAFNWEDPRGIFDVAFIFKNYFGAQLEHYRGLNLNVTQLKASSYSVLETIVEIDGIIRKLEEKKQKAIFVTHSLGGLALLDYLIANDKADVVKGIVFLQSPFYGSPVASVYFENPYHARTVLGPIMHFVNTSEASVKYLTLESRQKLMMDHEQRINDIIARIPMVTAGGTSLKYKSLLRASMNIIGHGCPVYSFGKCRSRKIFKGPFSDSDGMVPFESSKLPGVDFVELVAVDHGETVLSMPYKSISRVHMTDSMMKLLLQRIPQ